MLVGVTLGQLHLVISLAVNLSAVWVHILRILLSAFWTSPDHWDADDIALEIWTDGSREDFHSSGGFDVAGAGVYLPASELAFEGSEWGTAEEYGDARRERCRAFMPVPGILQTVQRAEFRGPIVAMQAYWPCH